MLGRARTVLLLLVGAGHLLGQTNQQAFRQTEVKLKEAVARKPDSFEANYQLAELYLSVGSIKAGIPYLEKAQRLNPSHYSSGLRSRSRLSGDPGVR